VSFGESVRQITRLVFDLAKAAIRVTGVDDYYLQISKGQVSGHVRSAIVGHNDNVSAVSQTVWPATGNVPKPLATAVIMTVSSTNANDTLLGTGAREIFISGVTDGYIFASETVETDGVNPVNTVNTYIHINQKDIPAGSAGALGGNIGTIYIGTGTVTAGVPAVVFNLIEPLAGVSRSCFFSVPADKYIGIVDRLATLNSNKTAILSIETTLDGVTYRGNINNLVGQIPLNLSTPTSLIPPETFLEVRGNVDTGSGELTEGFGIIIIDSSLVSLPLLEIFRGI